jgi:L-amino acid N-acyltransferase YncA
MLEHYPKEIVIKDGTPVVIRPATKEDEQALNEFFSRIPQDERWFLRDDLADPVDLRRWIEQLDYNKVIPLVAVNQQDGAIIAEVRLHRRLARCLRHVAHLRIGVDPTYRNQRLGTWMLIDVIKLAMDLGLDKLLAEFVQGAEEAAIHAARRLDFFEHAIIRDYCKDVKGNYHDLLIMVKTLHSDWCDF